MGMRQTPVVSRSMAGSPRERAAPHRMLSAAEVGGLLTGCSGPPGPLPVQVPILICR